MTLTPVPDEPRGRTRRPTATARFGSSRRENHDASALLRPLRPARDLRRHHHPAPRPSSTSSTATTPATWPRSSRTRWPSSSPRRPTSRASSTRRASATNGVPGHLLRVPQPAARRVRRVQAGARAGWSHRRQRGQPRAPPLPLARRRRHRDPAGARAAAAGRGGVVEGPGRRRVVRLGHVPAPLQPGAARRHRAHRHRQQGPLRPCPHAAAAPQAGPARRRPRSPATSSSRPPPTCGRSRPRAPRRSGTPRRSPCELPKRLIELYTYEDDVVLDPFMGSGSTAVAAVRTDRHYIGFDTDKAYVDAARERAKYELLFREEGLNPLVQPRPPPRRGRGRRRRGGPGAGGARGASGQRGGRGAAAVVRLRRASGPMPSRAGSASTSTSSPPTRPAGAGPSTCRAPSPPASRASAAADTLWKALGKAAVLHESNQRLPLVLLTTEPAGQGQRRAGRAQGGARPGQGGVRRGQAARRRRPRAAPGLRRRGPTRPLNAVGAHHRHRARHGARHVGGRHRR